jgi:ABC-2 type transport system permease protein
VTDAARQRAERLATLPFEQVGGAYKNFFAGTVHSLRQLWQHRELEGLLVRRELKARYKDSSLGFLWSLIKPLTLLLVYYFAIGKILGAERSTPMFAILVFAGLTIWGLFSEILTTGTMSIMTNAGLIKKVYVPREIFPLAAVGSALFNFVIQFGVLLVAIIVFGQFTFTWQLLYFFPAVLIVLLFGTAFAILLSAWNVYLRDIQYLVDVAMMILVWASPIIYSFANVSHNTNNLVTSIYLLNPMTIAVIAFQRAMWLPGPNVQGFFHDHHVDPSSYYPADLDLRLVVLIVIGIVFLWLSHRIFLRLQGNFAQEI